MSVRQATLKPGITPVGGSLPDGAVHAHHLYAVRIDRDLAGASRDEYGAALTTEGIGTGLHFLAAHELTYYRRRFPDLRLPVAERAAREVLSLPLSPAHSLADIDDAVTALRKVHARYAGR